jgi:hypothetical protein
MVSKGHDLHNKRRAHEFWSPFYSRVPQKGVKFKKLSPNGRTVEVPDAAWVRPAFEVGHRVFALSCNRNGTRTCVQTPFRIG